MLKSFRMLKANDGHSRRCAPSMSERVYRRTKTCRADLEIEIAKNIAQNTVVEDYLYHTRVDDTTNALGFLSTSLSAVFDTTGPVVILELLDDTSEEAA